MTVQCSREPHSGEGHRSRSQSECRFRSVAEAQTLAAAIRHSSLKPAGINLHLADGEAAGQEIFHVHVHVIPRYRGDGFGLKLPAGYGPHADRERLNRDAAAITQALQRGPHDHHKA